VGVHQFDGPVGEQTVLIYLVKVISAATGAGIYNCAFLSIDKTNWGAASGGKMVDLVAAAWSLGKIYAEGSFATGTDSKPYRCKVPHTATNYNKPITGADCLSLWELADSIEVLNLFENFTTASPQSALAADDRMEIWQMTDDGGSPVVRWVGVPLEGTVRRAKVKANAGSDQFVTCNLLGYNGNEITSGLGSGITVNFKANKEGTPTSWQLNQTVPRIAADDIISVENHSGKWWLINNLGKSEDKPL